jgi:hypothetical protein
MYQALIPHEVPQWYLCQTCVLAFCCLRQGFCVRPFIFSVFLLEGANHRRVRARSPRACDDPRAQPVATPCARPCAYSYTLCRAWPRTSWCSYHSSSRRTTGRATGSRSRGRRRPRGEALTSNGERHSLTTRGGGATPRGERMCIPSYSTVATRAATGVLIAARAAAGGA